MVLLRLKSLRKYNDMTRKELADRIGVSEPTIAAYEQGVREPNIDKLKRLSELFNVSIDHLVGNDKIKN